MKTFPATVQVTADKISHLLSNAFAGGSNYWYDIKTFIEPSVIEYLSDAEFAKSVGNEPKIYKYLDYPLNAGGGVIITSKEDDEINGQTEFLLNLDSIGKGIQIMAEKYPKHFTNFIEENDDAETGDVFLQCCLFGETIYG